MRVGSEVRDAGSEKRHHVTHEGQGATQADGGMKEEQSAGNKALRQHGVRACVRMFLLRRHHRASINIKKPEHRTDFCLKREKVKKQMESGRSLKRTHLLLGQMMTEWEWSNIQVPRLHLQEW